MFPLRSDRLRPVFRHVDLSPRRRCLSAVAAMHVTPRTCPGPGDLWRLSPAEEKREERYERLWEQFVENYIPRLGNPRVEEVLELGIDDDPEVDRLFDQFLEEHEWR